MARHLSVVVILAIAAFVVLSFMTSFGGRTEQIQQMLPVAGVSERPQVAPEAPAPVPDLKPEVTLDSKLDIKPDGKSETQSGFASLSSDLLTGGAIAPKLENATIKCALLFSYVLLPGIMLTFFTSIEPNSVARPGNSSTP